MILFILSYLILIVYIAYNLVALGIDAKEYTDSLMMSDDLSEVLLDIALQKDTEIALFDSTGETLVNTFKDFPKASFPGSNMVFTAGTVRFSL